jgi:hypothetical protein
MAEQLRSYQGCRETCREPQAALPPGHCTRPGTSDCSLTRALDEARGRNLSGDCAGFVGRRSRPAGSSLEPGGLRSRNSWGEIDAERMPGPRPTAGASLAGALPRQGDSSPARVPKMSPREIGIPLRACHARSLPASAVDSQRSELMRWRIDHAPLADSLAAALPAHPGSCSVPRSIRKNVGEAPVVRNRAKIS